MIAVIGGTTEAMIAPVIFERSICGETLGKADLLSVDASDHHVRVANVNSEKHAVPPYL